MKKTQFEIAQEQANTGKLQIPHVWANGGEIPYFGYQVAVHVFNLSIMSKGMKCRGITFRQIKDYYGLKGRSAADCLPQLKQIQADLSKKTQFANAKN